MLSPPTKLCCDVMLGRIARWLRLGGYDTYYNNQAEDQALIELCLNEERFLLTRDRQLAQKIPKISYCLQAEIPRQQLAELITNLQLKLFTNSARCSLCNSKLIKVDKNSVAPLVPAYVCLTQNDFSICPLCQKIYWKGTHWERLINFFSNF